MPKVRFVLNDADHDAEFLYQFCKPRMTGWDWSRLVFQIHPEMKRELDRASTDEERRSAVKMYVKEFMREEKELLKSQVAVYQKEWNKVNDRYMRVLSHVLEATWPRNRKIITAYVSLNPISPRFLDSWSFMTFMLKRTRDMKRTTAHELLHFLYFKKWEETFPDAKKETFNSPHLEWHLSEILAPIILNDPRIQKVIKGRSDNYSEHKKAMIGKKSVVQHFEKLYSNSMKRGDSFSRFLEIAYSEARKNKDAILGS